MWMLALLVIVYTLVVVAGSLAVLAILGQVVYNVPRRWRTTRHEKAHPSSLVESETQAP
jgi:hypothetical protein